MALISPIPRTPAQIAAARLNGRQSRGPVTDRGKLNSAHAGLRHGLTAASPLIKGESRAAFDSLLAEFHRTHSPVGLPEELCVFHMATAQWKLLRAMQFESDLINEHMSQTPPAGPPPDSLPAIRRASHAVNAIEARPHSLTNIRFHTTHLERSIERHFRQLLALQAIRAHENGVDPNNELNPQD